jgi:nitrate reductase beta subunit
MRSYMRARTVDGVEECDPELEAMYRLLAIARYDERFVVPPGRGTEAMAMIGCGDGCG